MLPWTLDFLSTLWWRTSIWLPKKEQRVKSPVPLLMMSFSLNEILISCNCILIFNPSSSSPTFVIDWSRQLTMELSWWLLSCRNILRRKQNFILRLHFPVQISLPFCHALDWHSIHMSNACGRSFSPQPFFCLFRKLLCQILNIRHFPSHISIGHSDIPCVNWRSSFHNFRLLMSSVSI